jgi:hypothetical protein
MLLSKELSFYKACLLFEEKKIPTLKHLHLYLFSQHVTLSGEISSPFCFQKLKSLGVKSSPQEVARKITNQIPEVAFFEKVVMHSKLVSK